MTQRWSLAATLAVGALSAGLWAARAPAADAEPRFAAPGPHPVGELLGEWRDEARDRTVPYKVYYPADATGCAVVVFSHGLGGSRETYAFQGRHWASHGLVSVHLQHPGSDESLWRGVPPAQRREALSRALANPRNALERPRDVKLAVDRLEAMDRADGPLRGRLDLARLGMAGHSFGAWTTQAIIGQRNPRGRLELGFHDPRFRAAVIESPNNPSSVADPAAVYGGIEVPCLHLTGTKDDSPIGADPTRAADRRVPYDHITGADQYLLVLREGDHMIFSGRSARDRDAARDERFHALILEATTAFWQAHLLGDAEARAYLAEGGFAAAAGADGTFEAKQRSATPPETGQRPALQLAPPMR